MVAKRDSSGTCQAVGLVSSLASSKANNPERASPSGSWRVQDANVDPLIRQITLGHKPTTGNGLGMTGTYTHTRLATQHQQIEQALRIWPQSLSFAQAFVGSEKATAITCKSTSDEEVP